MTLIEPIIELYNANVLSTPSPNEILRTVNDEFIFLFFAWYYSFIFDFVILLMFVWKYSRYLGSLRSVGIPRKNIYKHFYTRFYLDHVLFEISPFRRSFLTFAMILGTIRLSYKLFPPNIGHYYYS